MKHLTPPITVAVLTVSDRCSQGETVDTSGPGLQCICREQLGAIIVEARCVPDEFEEIKDALQNWATQGITTEGDTRVKPDLILSTGGTGLSPRDITPEATAAILERRHPALLELARMRCYQITPRTFLSRGESGTLARSLIINLPGSVRGSSETFSAILDILPHAIETLRGDVQDDGRPDAIHTTGNVVRHQDRGDV